MIAFYSNIFHKIIYFTYDVIIIIGYHTLTTNLLIFFNQGQLFIRYFTFTIRCLKLQTKASLCQMIDSNNNIWLPSCISLFPGAYPFVWSILVLTTLGDNNSIRIFFSDECNHLVMYISPIWSISFVKHLLSCILIFSPYHQLWSLVLLMCARKGVEISSFLIPLFACFCWCYFMFCVVLFCQYLWQYVKILCCLELFPHSLFYCSTPEHWVFLHFLLNTLWCCICLINPWDVYYRNLCPYQPPVVCLL